MKHFANLGITWLNLNFIRHFAISTVETKQVMKDASIKNVRITS